MKNKNIFLCVVLALISGIFLAQAVPRFISFQGRLSSSGGVPVTGEREMTFSIYDGDTASASLWSETHTVQVNKGIYHVILGSVSSLGLSFDETYYLGIKVGADPEMTPRIRLTSKAYALRADIADTVKDGAITAEKLGEPCAVGQMLVKTASGWACGNPPY
jgi:hypothetical protein